MNYPKLFVVGCPRSGTSWVTGMLAQHPDVVMVPAETHLYRLVYDPFLSLPNWSFRQRKQAWKGILRRYGLRPLLLGIQSDDIWRGILRNYQILARDNVYGLHALVSYPDLQALIKAVRAQPLAVLEQAERLIVNLLDHFFEKTASRFDQTLLEKTPLHIQYATQILRQFPEAQLIEVIRDGRDVCASYNALAQQQAWARVGTQGAIQRWKRCIHQGNTVLAQSEMAARFYRVRYESLKLDPEESLQHLFNFAHLPYTSARIQKIIQASDIRQIVHKGDGQYIRKGIIGDWKTTLTPSDLDICHQIAGEELTHLGYL